MAKHMIIPAEQVERRIMLIRGQKVMLDSDLAALYGVPTGGSESGGQAKLEAISR